jgi:hypothetical protein
MFNIIKCILLLWMLQDETKLYNSTGQNKIFNIWLVPKFQFPTCLWRRSNCLVFFCCMHKTAMRPSLDFINQQQNYLMLPSMIPFNFTFNSLGGTPSRKAIGTCTENSCWIYNWYIEEKENSFLRIILY